MSFTVKTFGLDPEASGPTVQLANIYPPFTDYYLLQSGRTAKYASIRAPNLSTSSKQLSIGIMPHYTNLNKACGRTTILEWDHTVTGIYFPIIGADQTYLQGSPTSAHSMNQNITAFPVTMPRMSRTGHKGFCDYTSGFGFAFGSYLDGFVVSDIGVGDFLGEKPFFTKLDYENNGLTAFGFAHDPTYPESIPGATTGDCFMFSNNILQQETEDWIDGNITAFETTFSLADMPAFIPFYYKAKIAAFAGYSRAFNPISERRLPKATAVLAEANVLPFYRSHDIAQTGGVPEDTGAYSSQSDPKLHPDGPNFYKLTYEESITAHEANFDYPYVAASSVLAESGGFDYDTMTSIPFYETRDVFLYSANVSNDSTNTALINNIKKRYIDTSANWARANDWIAKRVAYISVSLDATLSVEAPKAFRVKKQISPDIHKRDYTTFDRDVATETVERGTSTATTTYSGGSGASTGGSY